METEEMLRSLWIFSHHWEVAGIFFPGSSLMETNAYIHGDIQPTSNMICRNSASVW